MGWARLGCAAPSVFLVIHLLLSLGNMPHLDRLCKSGCTSERHRSKSALKRAVGMSQHATQYELVESVANCLVSRKLKFRLKSIFLLGSQYFVRRTLMESVANCLASQKLNFGLKSFFLLGSQYLVRDSYKNLRFFRGPYLQNCQLSDFPIFRIQFSTVD